MSERWGRADSAGTWPHAKPMWTIAAVFVALAIGAALITYDYAANWTPLQRLYLGQYVRSAALATLRLKTDGHYRLLSVIDRRGTRMALESEVRSVTVASGARTFALSDAAVRAGDQRLIWQDGTYAHDGFHAFLQRWIYRDHSVADLLMPPVRRTIGVLAIVLLVAVPFDLKRARERRHGHRLKGPELVSARQLNRRLGADGVGFAQRARWWRQRQCVRVPRALESSHFLIMGDSGTGKSALIRQLLIQLEHRAETAIVYDPALEYTSQFYTPDRGDLILNPLDARSPYWSPSEEWRHGAETLTLATSLFPDRSRDNAFFTEAPRRIFAHL